MQLLAETATGVDLTDALRTVAVNSAYNASRALSKWFKRGVRLTCDGFASVPIQELTAAVGPPEEPIAAAHMALEGDLAGDILLAFPEKVALSLVDLMIGAPENTSTEFTDLERSCLQETGNIVGSAFTNCLANWLKLRTSPGAPTVVHDLGCAVVEPLLVSQASVGDHALLAKTEFELDNHQMDWRLLFLPSAEALAVMNRQCATDQVRQNALHTIAINAAFDASRAMSKWLKRGVRLSTEGFVRVPLREACTAAEPNEPVVALHLQLGQQLHGHALMVIPMKTALELAAILMGGKPGSVAQLDEMASSCLYETGNIVGSSFVNSWAKWLEIHSEPAAPKMLVDLPEPIFQSVVVEQARVSDDVFMAKAVFSVDGRWLDWDFYLLPTPASMKLIEAAWQ